jgi:hypothetical protein
MFGGQCIQGPTPFRTLLAFDLMVFAYVALLQPKFDTFTLNTWRL